MIDDWKDRLKTPEFRHIANYNIEQWMGVADSFAWAGKHGDGELFDLLVATYRPFFEAKSDAIYAEFEERD